MPSIYFIHGLGSLPTTTTGTRIDAITGVTSVKLDYRAEKTWEVNWLSLLEQTKDATMESIFIGESMGGFWAAQLSARFHARCYLLNPCIAPAWQVRQFIGPFNQGYGNVNITEETVRSYNVAQDQRTPWNKGKIGLILSPEDTTIDPHYTNTCYKDWTAFIDWVNDGHAIALDTSYQIIGARIAAWSADVAYSKCLYCIQNGISA